MNSAVNPAPIFGIDIYQHPIEIFHYISTMRWLSWISEGVENSSSLGFQYKKNSKKKHRHVKVDLKNGDVYDNNDISNNSFAPVVLAGEKPVVTTPRQPPTTIYAHVQKSDTLPKKTNTRSPTSVNTTLPKSEVSGDVPYFDPNEFDVEEQEPTTLKSTYTNSTYDYQQDDDIDNKPSFLIWKPQFWVGYKFQQIHPLNCQSSFVAVIDANSWMEKHSGW